MKLTKSAAGCGAAGFLVSAAVTMLWLLIVSTVIEMAVVRYRLDRLEHHAGIGRDQRGEDEAARCAWRWAEGCKR